MDLDYKVSNGMHEMLKEVMCYLEIRTINMEILYLILFHNMSVIRKFAKFFNPLVFFKDLRGPL